MDTLDNMTVEELERLAERASNTATQKREATQKLGVPYRWTDGFESGYAVVTENRIYTLRDGSGILRYSTLVKLPPRMARTVFEKCWLDQGADTATLYAIAKLYMAAYHGDAR